MCALATGFLTLQYLSGFQKKQEAKVIEMRPVVLANRTIGSRVKITPQMLTKVTRPVTDIPQGALTDPGQAVGDVALAPIPANSLISSSQIGQPAAIGVTGRLRPGMRAVSIPVDNVKSVSGLVEPGDRVDVMATEAGLRPPRTVTVIRGAIVLAINATLDPPQVPPESPAAAGAPAPAPASGTGVPPAAVPATVTLGVTPEQANLLTLADMSSTLRLALRSPDESIRSLPAEPLAFPDSNPPSASNNQQLMARPVASAAPSAAASDHPGYGSKMRRSRVEVIEGSTIAAGNS